MCCGMLSRETYSEVLRGANDSLNVLHVLKLAKAFHSFLWDVSHVVLPWCHFLPRAMRE